MSTTGFGVPSYTAGRKNRWPLTRKLKFAPIFRILPQANGNPNWYEYFRKHFGFSIEVTNNGKTREIPKPWGCILEQDRTSKMVTRECEECSVIAKRTFEKTQLDVAYKGGTLDGKTYQEKVEPINKFLMKHNLDKRYWMNAINVNGEVGLLGLKYKAYKALRACMDEALKAGIDPLRVDQGVQFEFTITGETFNDTEYQCKIVKEVKNIDGIGYETIKRAPLTQEQLASLPPLCWDLRSQEVSGIITPAQVKALVESGGDPKLVEQILGTSAAAEDGDDETPAAAAAPASVFTLPQAVAYPAPTPPPAPAPAALSEFEQFQAWQRQQARNSAVPAATPAATPASTTAPSPTNPGFAVGTPTQATVPQIPAGDLSHLSPEDFMARFGQPGKPPIPGKV